MDEILKQLACFGCPYTDDCEDEWEEGHVHCDEMMKDAKVFVERTGIGKVKLKVLLLILLIIGLKILIWRCEVYGYINGITDTSNIEYCPKCGAMIGKCRGDGTAECDECGFHFGVVECEED